MQILFFQSYKFYFFLNEGRALDKKPARITDLFTNGILFVNLCLISTAWFATGMMFYGLSIYMPEFRNTDVRLITFLLGLAEIPADTIPIIALNR